MAVRGRCGHVDHHDAFRETSNACTCLQMGNVALGAGLQYGELALVHDCHEGADLDGVTQRSPRAVALCDGNGVGVDARKSHGLLDDRLLRRPIGRRQAGTAAVLVRRRANEGADALLLFLLVALEKLDVDGTASLTSLVAIGTAVEGEAAPLVGKHRGHAIANERARAEQGVDALHQCLSIVLARWVLIEHQQVCGVHGHQGCRACRVVGGDGTPQVENVSQSASGHGVIHACTHESWVNVPVEPAPLRLEAVPIGTDVAKPNAHATALEALPREARGHKALVAHLQRHALARQHGTGLCVVDAEELVVELRDHLLADEAAMASVGLAGERGVNALLVVRLCVPTVVWPLAASVAA
mmetsp:Transcript_33817/g.78643  ORF Transcript_33817/g.78643 Transcript_33817/m.78643 type:complete len:357 (-) Transcript_33817:439-1509(-)